MSKQERLIRCHALIKAAAQLLAQSRDILGAESYKFHAEVTKVENETIKLGQRAANLLSHYPIAEAVVTQ